MTRTVAAASPGATASDTAEWTWLIYMAGDNNLEGAGLDDLSEMKKIGSTKAVNVLVQFDTEENRTSRYRVERNSLRTLQAMPGVNCGDPNTLTDFLQWGIAKFPARHYLVDIWNHGGGWENLPPDYDYGAIRSAKPFLSAKLRRFKRALFRTTIAQIDRMAVEARAIAIDCGSHDYLDNQELRGALARALPNGRKFDILGCDACLMNMLEIAYEMKGTADFMVGSEETEPASGWPYADILRRLAAKPTMPPKELAVVITEEYGKWYQANGDPQRDRTATQSALDLSRVEAVTGAVNRMAVALREGIGTLAGTISLARDRSLKFEMPEYIDLGDFASQLEQRLPEGEAKKAAGALASMLKDQAAGGQFVVANALWGKDVERATGVSVYFPHSEDYASDYSDLAYSKDGQWNSLLRSVFNA